MIRKMVGILCVGVGTAVALAGCGEQEMHEDCFTDNDCQITEICYDEGGADSYQPLTCVPQCDDDQDCAVDEECQLRDDGQDGEETICLQVQEPTLPCTSDDDCAEGEICDTGADGEGTCVPEGNGGGGDDDGYDTVRITDGGDFATDGTYGYNTAGVALYEIALLDEGNSPVSFATAVEYNMGSHNNFNVQDDAEFIFDGTDPGFGMMCPTMDSNFQNSSGADRESNFTYNQVLLLGNNGDLYVQFFDGGEPMHLPEGYSVEIFTYGHECGFVHADESWNASTMGWSDCDDVRQTAQEEDWEPFCPRSEYASYHVDLCDDHACDIELGTGFGHREVFPL